MVYEAWPESVRHTIQNYQGEGFICKFPISWLPGMAGDFRDIRFSDHTESILSYWIESYTAFATALVHVRLGRSSTVFLHYGSGSAVSESNGNTTFEFFDHFTGAAIDATKWDVYTGSTYTVGSSELFLSSRSTSVAPWYGEVQSKIAFVPGYEIVARAKVGSTLDYTYIGFANPWYGVNSPNYKIATVTFIGAYGTIIGAQKNLGANATLTPTILPITINQYYRLQVKRPANGSLIVNVDGGADQVLAAQNWTDPGYLNISNWNSRPEGVSVDFVFVKKYTPTEPTAVRVSGEHRIQNSWRSWLAYNDWYRESGLSVSVPESSGSRTLGSVRPADCTVSALNIAGSRTGDHPRAAGFSVSSVDVTASRTTALNAQAGLSVPSVLEKVDSVLRHSPPHYPYAVTLEFEGEQVVSDQITAYDTVDIRGTLYDTDPITGEQRPIPLAGFVVKAVIRGGSPARTVVKDCVVLSGGQVTFNLSLTDTSVPGKYVCKFVVLGEHFSVTGYRKELPEKRADVPLIRVNDSRAV